MDLSKWKPTSTASEGLPQYGECKKPKDIDTRIGSITSNDTIWGLQRIPGDKTTYWHILRSIKIGRDRYRYVLQRVHDDGYFLPEFAIGFVSLEKYVNPDGFKMCHIVETV